jgi:hypothetical protein
MKETVNKTTSASEGSSAPLRELLPHIRRIDRLIQARVATVRQSHPPESQFQGLVISEEEVDRLLAPAPAAPKIPSGADADPDYFECVSSASEGGSRLQKLASLFRLSLFEADCLLICVAPEIDSRYERLYAYLQDDVTKRRPAVDLVLDLLCPNLERKMTGRRSFLSEAPLVRHRLVQLFEDPAKPFPTLLARCVRIDARIVS